MDIYKILEIIATISGIACVYLQTREKIMAWPFGILSVSLSVVIFYQSKLYSDLMLHLVYVGLNIYGWWHWRRRGTDVNPAPILKLKTAEWIGSIILVIVGTSALGSVMKSYTDADLPYFDAFTTAGSLVAQYILARKILENRLVWIVVDVVAINMYLYKGLHFIAFMFFVYLLLCIKGYIDWKRRLKLEATLVS